MAGKYRFIKGPLSVDDANKKKQSKKAEHPKENIKNIENQGEIGLGEINISEKLQENIDNINIVFKDCSDLEIKKFTVGEDGICCFIVFIDEIVKKELVNDNILKPLMADLRLTGTDKKIDPMDLAALLSKSSIYSCEMENISSFKDIVKKILYGSCALFIDGCKTVLSIDVRGLKGRDVTRAKIEAVVRGPQEAFVEDLKTNLSLLRRRLKTPDFKLEKLEIGKLSNTAVIISYIKGIADESTINEIRKRLERIDVDIIIESGYIEKLIEDVAFSPFPQFLQTERPDVVSHNLAEGRIAIIIDGSNTVLLAPVTFSDFLSSSEDYYSKFYFSTFIRILRYTAIFIALLGPSLYIAITTFHQELIPLTLLVTIARSRSDVPFPAIVEAFLMEFTFELLREAGIRLPQPIGPAVTIVGGLVIGQGVVQAGIFSQTIVIVVAITGIASFSIPAFNAAITVRLLRFPIMIAASVLGMFGIIMCILVILVHLAGLRSVGVPYLSPFTPLSLKDLKDSIILTPLWDRTKRPSFIQKKNSVRMKSGLKPGPEKGNGG